MNLNEQQDKIVMAEQNKENILVLHVQVQVNSYFN